MSLTSGHVEGGYGIGTSTAPQGSIGKKVIHQLPRNPLDKTTLVSILPKIICEFKPTIFPGRFEVPAAEPGKFTLLVLEGTSWYLPSIVDRMPPMEIQVNSLQLAEAIVRDFNSSIYLSSSGRRPGLFFVPGEFNEVTILKYVDTRTKKNFESILATAREEQKRWFLAMVEDADKNWARTGGNPLSIMDDAKIGAHILGLKDKPWMQNQQSALLSPCPACGEMINLNYPICKHCHYVVNTARMKELDLTPSVEKK